MPVTFPAHQGLIVGAKLAAPRWVDGTALCLGAAAPDLAYGIHDWLGAQSHTPTGLVVWAVPLTLVSVVLLRWRAADGIFAMVPDLGPLQLNSYRVLGTRSPAMAITIISATAGSASHIVIDAFTHPHRWGANMLGLNGLLFIDPLGRDFTVADALQYLGHGIGSLLFVVAIVLISRSNSLQRWYGTEAVELARSAPLPPGSRIVFWAALGSAALLAALSAVLMERNMLFLVLAGVYGAALACGTFYGSTATD